MEAIIIGAIIGFILAINSKSRKIANAKNNRFVKFTKQGTINETGEIIYIEAQVGKKTYYWNDAPTVDMPGYYTADHSNFFVQDATGTVTFYRNCGNATSLIHRIDGPAIIYKDGFNEFWINGVALTPNNFVDVVEAYAK